MLADQLGYDAVVVNEHHNSAYSMMPTPNLIAATLIPQTKNCKICIWGTPPNFMLPNRLAEEYAVLDVLSKGRIEVAFPLGTGMEYWSNPVNPATAREKFKESLKIILQAWTEDGPTTHYGQFYTYRFLNPWPRPYQRPHPPCYIVGTGSPETIEIAAELGFGYASVFVTQQRAAELNETLRNRAAHYGHTMRPGPASAHVIRLRRGDAGACGAGIYRTPAALLRGLHAHHAAIPRTSRLSFGRAVEDTRRDGRQAARRLRLQSDQASHPSSPSARPRMSRTKSASGSHRMKTTHINTVMHVADMPHWKTVKNLTLFAEEVMPRLRSSSRAAMRIAAE